MNSYHVNNQTQSTALLTHSRRALFRVFDIGFGQIEGILGIILAKEFFKKSNYGNFHDETIH